MTRLETYIITIAVLCIGAAGGWFAGKAEVTASVMKQGIKCEISTAMPPTPGIKGKP